MDLSYSLRAPGSAMIAPTLRYPLNLPLSSKKLDFHLLEYDEILHLELGIYRQNPGKVRVVRIEYYGPPIELRLMGQFQQLDIGASL